MSRVSLRMEATYTRREFLIENHGQDMGLELPKPLFCCIYN
jgi:hypothetical protein